MRRATTLEFRNTVRKVAERATGSKRMVGPGWTEKGRGDKADPQKRYVGFNMVADASTAVAVEEALKAHGLFANTRFSDSSDRGAWSRGSTYIRGTCTLA